MQSLFLALLFVILEVFYFIREEFWVEGGWARDGVGKRGY
jgi:hypothetical protein